METKIDTLDTFINGAIPAELPQGWHQIFADMNFTLKTYLDTNGIPTWKLCFHQVKEKYGETRIYFYFDDDNDNIGADIRDACYDIIKTYCRETAHICNKCGATATYRSKDWILPWCRICADRYANERGLPKELLFTEIL